MVRIGTQVMDRNTAQWLIPALLAIGTAAALMVYWVQVNKDSPAPVEPPPVVAEPEPEPQIGPLHPLPEYETADKRPGLRILPPLDQSDEYLKLELTDLYGDTLAGMLAETGIIERIVATVDNLPRSQVAERIRPVGRMSGQFIADEIEEGEYRLNPENYHRYDYLVAMLTAADPDRIADTYRRYYPLLQNAYVDLGYPDGYFNDRLVEVIDHLLETPAVPDNVRLLRPHVLYEYADPGLEDRSSGQKLLMRMGDDNAAQIKQLLRDFRSRIAE